MIDMKFSWKNLGSDELRKVFWEATFFAMYILCLETCESDNLCLTSNVMQWNFVFIFIINIFLKVIQPKLPEPSRRKLVNWQRMSNIGYETSELNWIKHSRKEQYSIIRSECWVHLSSTLHVTCQAQGSRKDQMVRLLCSVCRKCSWFNWYHDIPCASFRPLNLTQSKN